MNKEEKQIKSVKEKVELIRKMHKKNETEEKKRLDRIIRQMKEGKLETLGTIVASDDGDIFIHIAGDKLIFMEKGFLHNFMSAIRSLDFPESDLIVARLMEFEAKQIRQGADNRIRQIKEMKEIKAKK